MTPDRNLQVGRTAHGVLLGLARFVGSLYNTPDNGVRAGNEGTMSDQQIDSDFFTSKVPEGGINRRLQMQEDGSGHVTADYPDGFRKYAVTSEGEVRLLEKVSTLTPDAAAG